MITNILNVDEISDAIKEKLKDSLRKMRIVLTKTFPAVRY